MHEFSLAQNILEIVEQALTQNNAQTAEKLTLEIGTLSGVEIPAMEMALDSIKSGTCLESASISIEIITARAMCTHCKVHYSPGDFFSACPKCGSYQADIFSGKELKVKSIVAEKND